ncbi:MAG: PBSX family phage terminase large subunit [Clostridia bacterium]|nr:PBSX family phage terminase large subunit [Clostridia bacterium]
MKAQTIKWQPFSLKHKRYIATAQKSKMSVAEGAIRSGKTIDHCIIACAYLETCPDKIHLASGSTIANAKMNIGDCNGFGLEHLFRGRCRWGKYKDNEALYIKTQTGEKIVVFAGGGKADSYKKILGNSYGLWIATEINQHYDNDDSETSFIKVAFGRQVASIKPMVLWDLNPSNPNHKIYADYIDKYKTDYVGGYNYQHFTIADNLSITEQRKKEIESQYNTESVWYRRDILGQRCVAEGLIYEQFADNPKEYSTDTVNDLIFVNIGVDFGGNGSATTFVATGFTKGLKDVIILDAERHAEQLNPEQLNEKFAFFVERCYNQYSKPISVYCDSAEQILIRGLKRVAIQRRLPIEIRNARKNPILERIRLVLQLMAQKRFYIYKAKTVTNALCQAVWDNKHPDQRVDDGKTCDVDTLDALEYSIEPFMRDLTII